MTASEEGNERTLLLILPTRKQIYPLSPDAPMQAQATRRELAKDYQDALILNRDRALRRIEHIEVIGLAGNSLGQKLLSWLTNAWRIVVRLSGPLPWQLVELKQLLADCINANGNFCAPKGEEISSAQQTAAMILAASSITEVFDILILPSPEGSLDVL